MPDHAVVIGMTPRELEEYRELRSTVRERGTARIWIFVSGVVAWAAANPMKVNGTARDDER